MTNLRRQGITISILILAILLLTLSNMFIAQKINGLQEQLDEQVGTLQAQQEQLYMDYKMLSQAMDNWLEYWQVDTFESTAYSPLDDQNGLNSWGDGSVMTSGAKTVDHIDSAIAVDPDVIPLGTKVWIQGVGWRIALDTGGVVKGNKLDICMRTFNDAVKYAKRDVIAVWPKQQY